VKPQAQKPKKLCSLFAAGTTSIIIPWLRQNYGCDVIAMIGDVGQQEDLEAAHRRPSLPERLRLHRRPARRVRPRLCLADVRAAPCMSTPIFSAPRWRGP